MKLQFIFLIIVLLVNFIIGLIVLIRDRKDIIARFFLLIIFSIILWIISNLLLDFIRNPFIGLFYPFFMVYFIGFMTTSLLILIKKLYLENGIERLQIFYLFIGVMLATIGSSLTNLIIPYFTGDFSISTYGPLFALFFVGFT